MSSQFLRADEVAEILDVSPSFAYKIIRELNMELDTKGYVTIAGRINRKYFYERMYAVEKED